MIPSTIDIRAAFGLFKNSHGVPLFTLIAQCGFIGTYGIKMRKSIFRVSS